MQTPVNFSVHWPTRHACRCTIRFPLIGPEIQNSVLDAERNERTLVWCFLGPDCVWQSVWICLALPPHKRRDLLAKLWCVPFSAALCSVLFLSQVVPRRSVIFSQSRSHFSCRTVKKYFMWHFSCGTIKGPTVVKKKTKINRIFLHFQTFFVHIGNGLCTKILVLWQSKW